VVRLIEDRKTPDWFLLAWTVIGLLALLAMVFVTPPFQVPDEAQHFFRAYQVSEGGVLPEVADGRAGGHLPAALPALATHFLGPVLLHGDRPVRATPLAGTLAAPVIPLNTGTRIFVDFAGYYAPLAYAGQAVAIKIGRMAGAGTLTLFYLARVSNALCALAVLYAALRLLPYGRELVAFIALLPMALSLYASCSPDAMIISTAFLFTALVLNRITAGVWSAGDSVIAIVCATTFCAIKPVYAPLLMLGFSSLFYSVKRGAVLWQQALVLAASLVGSVTWLHITAPAMVFVRTGTDVAAQLSYILHAPLVYVIAILHTLRWNGFFYDQFVGVLGWLSVPLPMAAYVLPPLALLAAWGGQERLPRRHVMPLTSFGLAIVAASTLLLMTALYLTWTPVGGFVVEGIQGRYFLPLAPLACVVFLAACARKQHWQPSTTQFIILGLIVVEAVIALATTASRYAVF
jgi:uncharacterized membrane protein